MSGLDVVRVRPTWIPPAWDSPEFQQALARAEERNRTSTQRRCRYGHCSDVYDARGRIFGGMGPVECPHELRGGTRGHGTYWEQFAPPCPVKPSKRRRRRVP